MEILKRRLHVFAAGLLVTILSITCAGNVTRRGRLEMVTKQHLNQDVATKIITLKLLTDVSTILNATRSSLISLVTRKTTKTVRVTSERAVATKADYITFVKNDQTGEDYEGVLDGGDDLLFGVTESPEDDPYATKTIPFRKCCTKRESFDAGLKCVKRKRRLRGMHVAADDKVGRKYKWFPTLIISGSAVVEQAPSSILNVSRIKVQYGAMPTCDDEERLILQWYKEEGSFFFIFASNGTIVELNHKSMETIAMWPVDAYCMDSVPSDEYSYYVAFLCPCIHKTCVRKCCPRGFYYNQTFNACNEFPNYTIDYSPIFFEDRKPFSRGVSYYLLRRMPVCGGKKIESHYSPNRSLFVQTNGSLLMQLENGTWEVLNNSRYCSDYFIDQVFHERLENVLFCIRDKQIPNVFRKIRIHRQRGDGDYFTINFFLFLVVLAFVVIYE